MTADEEDLKGSWWYFRLNPFSVPKHKTSVINQSYHSVLSGITPFVTPLYYSIQKNKLHEFKLYHIAYVQEPISIQLWYL